MGTRLIDARRIWDPDTPWRIHNSWTRIVQAVRVGFAVSHPSRRNLSKSSNRRA